MMTVIHMKRFSAAAGFVLAVLLLTSALSGQSDGTRQRNAPPTQPDQKAETVHVLMTTSKGDITLELNREKAPKSVENFLSYTEKGYYDGTIFHRVIDNFMIQGGGFTAGMEKKPTDDPIENEWKNGLKNERGTIAMARLGNQPNSATSQFFINVKDNTALDEPNDGAGYAVFGKVVAGMDVVDEIRKVQTGRQGMFSDVPVEPVVVRKVKKLTDAEARKRLAPVAPKTPE